MEAGLLGDLQDSVEAVRTWRLKAIQAEAELRALRGPDGAQDAPRHPCNDRGKEDQDRDPEFDQVTSQDTFSYGQHLLNQSFDSSSWSPFPANLLLMCTLLAARRLFVISELTPAESFQGCVRSERCLYVRPRQRR